ncbi:MAG: hypothetical protein HYU38_02170 [Candidatus Tectomicrobia bacterium]|nr:hypothetical protein [Candidatus Tectomicrobia bacterium]
MGKFVEFIANADDIDAKTSLPGVSFSDTAVVGTGASSLNTKSTGTAVGFLAAAEVADLGIGKAEGTNTAQGSSAVKVLQETLTFNGDKVVTVGSGTLVVNLANVINQQLISLGVGVTTSVTLGVAAGSTVKLTNNAFGTSAASGGKNTVSSNRSDLHNPHLNIGGIAVTIEGTDATGKLNGITAVGVGQDLSASGTSFSGNAAEGLKVRFTGTTDPTGLTVTVSQGSLTFQVGANNGQTVSQQLADVRSAQLGKTATGLTTTAKSVADINVTTGAGAADALRLVDAAIDQVTTARGNLGAFQANVLESTIASLGVAQENLAAAESAVRDADFADETVQFTRNQILLQAGTAILTQANAIPQAVLQLLR